MVRPLPEDPLGRFWCAAHAESSHPQEKRVFGILVTSDESRELIILGHSFVIRDAGSNAICIGAAHSFDVLKHSQRHRRGQSQLKIPPMFRCGETEFIDTDEIKAVFVLEGEPVVCDIDQVNYVDNYDVATFAVSAPDNRQIFNSRVAIDLGAPQIGEEVALFAYELSSQPLAEGRGQLSLTFGLRAGVVSDVQHGPCGIPGQSFCFKTTIPVLGGMSGGAIIRKPREGQPIVACGVVSSDLSEPNAFISFLTAGLSTASMLWPAMGLGLDVEIPPDDERFMFLGLLAEKGILDNRSDGVIVSVEQPEDNVHITYTDSRRTPPTRMSLAMPGWSKAIARS